MRRRDFIQTLAAAGAATALTVDRAMGEEVPPAAGSERLDTGWRFHLGDVDGGERIGLDDGGWERATLPHTARVEALVTGAPGSPTYQWQGTCWYRRPLRIPADAAGKKVFLAFEAAMNVADVWLDGRHVGRHMGGFTPFVLDLTGMLQAGRDSILAVRLDNRDNPVTGPKPLAQLDFNTYGGLYRYVHLILKDPLHITDPILANRPASGGVFITYPRVSPAAASVRVQTHVRNDHRAPRTFRIRTTVTSADGRTVASESSDPVILRPGADIDVVQSLEVANPKLWSPRAPNLHVVRSEIVVAGRVVDEETTRVGIRRIQIGRDGFRINGEKMFLRGTNRHQEHPYVGYAVPAAAQWRDAKRIKDAGFDYIRLSHYPHAPAFMDACDELGIVVMNSIPGWQYFGADPAFAELQYRNSRELVRRDRNRPSVILWEVSLNETDMPPAFIARTHAIAHQEYPGDQCYTCGWMRGYDVFIRARQHGGCGGVDDVTCLVSEYGDWEYYAMTAGLNQDAFQGLTPAESNSRQLRWQGERAMLQQALNFQEAHNDNRGTAAFADGLWVMYDYNRGYAPDIESSGCMDIMRLPKYAYSFFQSQRPADELGPMVSIASEWTADSPTDVRVFSNCQEVALYLNGALVERRRPDADRVSTHLAHPPFTFRLGRFTAGTLEAAGFIDGREVSRHTIRTPGPVKRLGLDVDFAGRQIDRPGIDLVFCRALLLDEAGMLVSTAWENVAFGATGDVSLVGANPFSSDAGVASILARTEGGAGGAVYALAIVRGEGGARILSATAAMEAPAAIYDIHYTVDGTEPGSASRMYQGTFLESTQIRAALVVEGRVVATLDERKEKFRVPPSAPPESREPFRHG